MEVIKRLDIKKSKKRKYNYSFLTYKKSHEIRSSFPRQGHNLQEWEKIYLINSKKQKIFFEANKVLDFKITEIMFEGNQKDLTETNIAQPAIFIHSIIESKFNKKRGNCSCSWPFTW